MKKLVVVESPAKVKSIEKYLGKEYEVQASYGHVVDLPKSNLGVDTEKNFEPDYVVSNKKSIKQLKKSFKGKKTLVLAVDPDREGEAIGWHVARQLGVVDKKGNSKKGKELQRIVFTSITKDAVKEAAKKPRKIDMNLVNAQQARRVLDRLVGYKLSPLLWKKIRYGLSAGRVQSVALRLIVEREEERDKFESEEYWSLEAMLEKDGKMVKDPSVIISLKEDDKEKEKIEGISFKLKKIDGEKASIDNKESAEKIIGNLKDSKWIVDSIKTKKRKKYPKPPFTTSTLQRTASSWFKFSAKRTMSVAQKLYEKGLITYMRTDSTNISKIALEQARKEIKDAYGDKYLPKKPKFYKTKAKVAQEAHEAIRPTDFGKKAKDLKLKGQNAKLYDLIYQRALASQMVPAQLEKARIDINVDKYDFRANGQRILFKGFLDLYPERVSENILPEIDKGDELNLLQIIAQQHFTQPPPRYSEASLIKILESYGIGRPSTYVPIIGTIQSRKYVIKEGRYFVPTDTGKVVIKLLKDHFSGIVDYDFTAEMENSLDEVAMGEKDWVKEIEEFYTPFEKLIEKKEEEIEKKDYTILGDAPKDIKCPECNALMKIKLGRYGAFYSCSKWPDCKGMRNKKGKSNEDIKNMVNKEEFKNKYQEAPKTEDGRDYELKSGRYGKFWAHPDYPKVKDAQPLKLKENCPECGNPLVERKGRGGKFFIGCSGYPKCRYIKKNKK